MFENPIIRRTTVHPPFRPHTHALANASRVTNRDTGPVDGTPPASPGATGRARDDDVFLRLAGVNTGDSAPPRGVVKEFPLKRVSGGGGAWLQCTHVAEGHAGAALALAAGPNALYSGGVDRTVRGWDLRAGTEAWRGWCGGAVGALAAGGCGASSSNLLLAAAGAAVRLFDTRGRTPLTTLWSSGTTGANAPARGITGEVAVTALALAPDSHRLYTAAGDKLRLWDLRMMECVSKVYSGHAAAVMCLGVGRAEGADLVCTGSKDHYVRTLELQHQQGSSGDVGGRRLLEPPHYDGVQALALSGDTLYSASRDTSLKRWSVRRNALTHGVMNAHKGWVTGVVTLGRDASDGDAYVATCGRDAALRLWEPTLRPAARAAALPDAAHALAAHPDPAAMTLYTAGNGGDVRAWRVVAER